MKSLQGLGVAAENAVAEEINMKRRVAYKIHRLAC